MSVTRPPSCMTGAEYVGWKMADADCKHDPRRRAAVPCDDCTADFRSEMACEGLCEREPRMGVGIPMPVLVRRTR